MNPVPGGPFPPECAREFEPVRLLSAGNFGVVFLATQVRLKRPVAVKVLHGHLLEDEGEVARFLAEARITAMLSHPCIVTVIQSGVENGVPWIVYEFVDGPTLEAYCGGKALDPVAAIAMGVQIAAALEAAHAHAVLHRDIKPANVLVSGDARAKVADFGVAKWTPQATSFTQSGVVMGTPLYLAPELADGAPASVRTDLYALGVTLYELLTGSPTAQPGVPLWVDQANGRRIPSPREVAPAVPPALDELVMGLLAPTAADRPAGATEVREALENPGQPPRVARPRSRTKSPVSPPRASTGPSAPHAWRWAAPVAVLLLAGALVRTVTRTDPVAPPASASAASTAPARPPPACEELAGELGRHVSARAERLRAILAINSQLAFFGSEAAQGRARLRETSDELKAELRALTHLIASCAEPRAALENPGSLSVEELRILELALAEDVVMRLRVDRLDQVGAITKELGRVGADNPIGAAELVSRVSAITHDPRNLFRVRQFLDVVRELLGRLPEDARSPATHDVLRDVPYVASQFLMFSWAGAGEQQFRRMIVDGFGPAMEALSGDGRRALGRLAADSFRAALARTGDARRVHFAQVRRELAVLQSTGLAAPAEVAAFDEWLVMAPPESNRPASR
jgi:hypothetical protein